MRFTHGCPFRCDNSICCAQKTDDTCRQSEELVHFQVSHEIHLPRHWYCSDSFVASISHELRTPLHGILAAAELLSDTQLNHTQSSFLQTVQACGTSLVETVNHVLDFTKLSGNSKAGGVEHVIRTTKCALHHCLLLSFLTIFRKFLPPILRIDVLQLIEEAVEGSWIGNRARMLTRQQESEIGSLYAPPRQDGSGKLVEIVIEIGDREEVSEVDGAPFFRTSA